MNGASQLKLNQGTLAGNHKLKTTNYKPVTANFSPTCLVALSLSIKVEL